MQFKKHDDRKFTFSYQIKSPSFIATVDMILFDKPPTANNQYNYWQMFMIYLQPAAYQRFCHMSVFQAAGKTVWDDCHYWLLTIDEQLSEAAMQSFSTINIMGCFVT